MSINEVFNKELEDIKDYISEMQESIDYIEEYGYVEVYENEKELKEKLTNIVNKLKECSVQLDEASDIVKEQFNY